MLLYQAVLEYAMGKEHHRVKPDFALYTLSVALSGTSFVGNAASGNGCPEPYCSE